MKPFANPFGRGVGVPGIPVRVSVNMFFDKAGVKAALSQIEWDGLSKASMRVRDIAKRSIKKRGMARPLLQIMKDNPGRSLAELAAMPGVPSNIQRKLRQRITEIVDPKGSPPGTPPYTHVPYGHMLGFRRNLYNAYDVTSGKAVVGPSKKGEKWGIPHLHEVGGKIEKSMWELNYKYPLTGSKSKPYQTNRVVRRVFRWIPTGKSPRNRGKWRPTNVSRMFPYPARPFMEPAMLEAIRRKDIPKAFQARMRS